MKILNVVGARPNFMKVAPIVREMRARAGFEPLLVHTGQHYDLAMSDAFFRDLELPPPDRHLGVGSGSHAEQTARILTAFEPVVLAERPNAVLVVGDVNSTLACALVAAKLVVPVIHVEAGLRCGDRGMPEEINRVLTDSLADLLLTPSPDADEHLRREGIAPQRIRRVGNVMIDSLLTHRAAAARSTWPAALGVAGRPYAVLTLHRPDNVDDPGTLRGMLDALGELARAMPVVFPAHPRTAARLAAGDVAELVIDRRGARGGGPASSSGILLADPAGYIDFLALATGAHVVLTDSGGLQEETTALGVPCLTLRDATERPITITEGSNTLVGRDPARIRAACADILAGRRKRGRVPELWDGRAAGRIVDAIVDTLGRR